MGKTYQEITVFCTKYLFQAISVFPEDEDISPLPVP
jgi:hypothetical protein